MQPFHNSILYQNIEIYVFIKSNGNSRRDTNKITIISQLMARIANVEKKFKDIERQNSIQNSL